MQILFSVYDSQGNKLGYAIDNINNLEDGKTWKFKAMYMGSENDVSIDIENPEISGF